MKLRIAALLAVIALAAAACGGDDEPTVQPDDQGEQMMEEADGGLPPVATVDNAFAPSMLEIATGEEVTIMVRNNGVNPHTFTIDELDVDTGVLNGGDTAEVTFTMPDEEVEYYCTVHGRAIMSGTISVG